MTTPAVVGGPTALDIVTLVIAGVGAVTGIAALALTWAQFALSGPRMQITASTAIGGEQGTFFLSITVKNRGRTAADVGHVSMRISGSQEHIPLGMLLFQGHAQGKTLPVRLEPFTQETWLVRAEPIVRDLQNSGKPTSVTPFVSFDDKEIDAKPVQLADIARHNE